MLNQFQINSFGESILSEEIAPLNQLHQIFKGLVFSNIVHIILALKGRLIVTGIGKSGIIGRKFSTTLSSTGTPSFYLHPAEASHGDLGMIGKQDIVFIISNSGETYELEDVLSYCLRYDNPIVAMTSNAESRLAKGSEHVILLPNVKEAGELSTPSTSTLIQLLMTDCIALTVAHFRGFSDDLLSVLHPGGKLGQLLLPINQFMSSKLPIVTKDSKVHDVIPKMSEFGTVGVIDSDGILIAILTDGDLRRHSGINPDESIEKVMTRNPISVESKTLVGQVLQVFKKHPINVLFVVDKEKPIGIVHIQNIIKL